MQNVDLEPMTDDEIYQMALEDWLGVLSRLWTAFGKPVDPKQMIVYRDMLSQVPLGLLEKAIDRVVQEHVYNSVPTIAQVWQAARKLLGNPQDVEQAIKDWADQTWYSMFVQFPAVQNVAEVVAVETVEVVA